MMNKKLMALGVTERNGEAVVSSRDIARVFGKNHAHVMRDIRIIAAEDDQFNQSNFGLVEYQDNKGEKRPEYLLNP